MLIRLNEEQAQQIASLNAELRMLRRLFDILPDLIFIKNTHSQFVYANTAVVHACGCERLDQILGKTDFDFFPKRLADEYFVREQEVIKTGEALLNHEELVESPNCPPNWLLTSKVALRDSKGHIIGVAGVGRDVTERKMMEEEKHQLELQHKTILEDLEQMQNQVVTVCAWTKRIKEQDHWISLEEFLEKHFHIGVSHGISKGAIDGLRKQMDDDAA